jgi:Uri superfamily endonuclease
MQCSHADHNKHNKSLMYKSNRREDGKEWLIDYFLRQSDIVKVMFAIVMPIHNEFASNLVKPCVTK